MNSGSTTTQHSYGKQPKLITAFFLQYLECPLLKEKDKNTFFFFLSFLFLLWIKQLLLYLEWPPT